MIKNHICVVLLVGLLVVGCAPEERPEATVYRKQVEALRLQNRELQQEAYVAARMLNVTTTALVIVGSALAVSLFAIRWTHRRRT